MSHRRHKPNVPLAPSVKFDFAEGDAAVCSFCNKKADLAMRFVGVKTGHKQVVCPSCLADIYHIVQSAMTSAQVLFGA